ncbi:unnamed protein product [Cyprideis torosa]|uniref:Transcriptional regulator ycf27 n=1 Tax=Cyprideis torosa TaxID=163714 RepID=A0A7R9A0I2_9CRUS|nr:unnamed protein product [Cyprideis torosa]CAG0911017.1 unnamed protein product [Cyprideis torosa]
MRVLLIEDDSATAQSIELMLKSESFNVYTTDLGEEGVDLGKLYDYDIILLDLNLPDMSGYEVLRTLRLSKVKTPILILSGLAGIEDKVRGLGFGADDYMTKPFSMEELLLRINAVLRRTSGMKDDSKEEFQLGKYVFDSKKQQLIDGEKVLKLTTKESELLKLLCNNANEVLERNLALKTIWSDDNYFNARSMDVYITKLRKHLKDEPSIEIINVHGRGYKLLI